MIGIKQAAIALVATLATAAIAGTSWIDRQFEEPAARLVPSLAGEVGARSVVAVFAHPDDEQLITGLLIRARQRDHAVTRMITATRGEAGTPMPAVSRRADLGIIRHAEALKNGFALGLSNHVVWDLPDGGLTRMDADALAGRIEAQLRRWQPDLVVTFWPASGFSNHPDHRSIGAATTLAVRRLRADRPDLAPRAIAYILAPRRMMGRFGGDRGRVVVAHQPVPNFAMPGEGWAKIRGWSIHASQRDYVQRTYGMPPWLLHRLYDKEHYLLVRFPPHTPPLPPVP